MKIALIGQRYNPFLNSKILGGSERVERLYIDNIPKLGYDLSFITSNDSEESSVPTFKISIDSIFKSGLKGAKNLKDRSLEIQKILRRINPDLIIVNDDLYSSLYHVIKEYPSILLIHQPAGSFGLLSIGYAKTYSNVLKNGRQLCVGVSELSNKAWKNFYQDMDVEDYIHNIILEEQEVIESNGDVIKVGRMTGQKNWPKADKWFGKIDKKLICVCPEIKDESEKNIFESLKHSDFCVGLNREEVLEKIKKSSLVCVFGDESFGLSAVEANSFGVSVLLCNNNEFNGVKESCVENGLIKINNFEEFSNFFKNYKEKTLQERKNIAKETQEKYSLSNFQEKFNFLVEKSLNMFNEESRIEDFFV